MVVSPFCSLTLTTVTDLECPFTIPAIRYLHDFYIIIFTCAFLDFSGGRLLPRASGRGFLFENFDLRRDDASCILGFIYDLRVALLRELKKDLEANLRCRYARALRPPVLA